MNRLIIALATLLLLFAVSCGGGTTTLPTDQGNPGVENTNQAAFGTPTAPTNVVGDHSVSIVPGQLNVVAGTDAAGLAAIATKYGYDVLHHDGAQATLGIPIDADVEAVATQFAKEFNIVSAEPVHRINTPVLNYDQAVTRQPSFTPLNPMYGDQFVSFGNDGVDWTYILFPGQASVMGNMGFPGAWDVGRHLDVQDEACSVAIIDAGWFDYSAVNRAGLNEAILDDVNSGMVASDGTFTAGLTAATWELNDDGDDATRDMPYRDAGELMLGMLAADQNTYFPRGYDFDGSTVIDEDEVWNDGIAGINPFINYMLVKTGVLDTDTWSFTDNHIAESIDHAVGAGANIIVLGMFGVGAVGANVSAAIQNARDNDVLVIAPAGDVISTWDGDLGDFTGTPVDILVDEVSPASDPNCVSVTGTGFGRMEDGTLPPVDFGGGDVPNVGRGWYFGFNPPFEEAFTTVTDYCNTGADIAATGFGIGFSYHPNFQAGTPTAIIPGESYNATIGSFGTLYATAYVAGTASIIFQALSQTNGIPPTDDEVEAALLGAGAVDFAPLTGTDNGGYLNASKAVYGAFGGGVLYSPAMNFTAVTLSQPLSAVTRGTDLSITPVVADGTGPFSIEIDWGSGIDPTTVDPWVNGDPVTLVDGYENLGLSAINITVTDANGQEANIAFEIHVINPLAVTINVSDVTGIGVPLLGIQAGTQYRFNANATNVYTGEIDGVPNTTTFNWYFEGLADPLPFPLPAADATGPSPVFAFPTPGSYSLTLVVEEDVRPNSIFRVNVTVS